MPVIPDYNFNQTEEASLDRAKKRIIKAQKKAFSQITEYPLTDPTGGDADNLALSFLKELLDAGKAIDTATAVFGINQQTGNTNLLPADFRNVVSDLNAGVKFLKRSEPILQQLIPAYNFVSLTNVSTIKNEVDNVEQGIDEISGKIGLFQRRQGQMNDMEALEAIWEQAKATISRIQQKVSSITENYVAARQQRQPDPSEKSGGLLPIDPRDDTLYQRRLPFNKPIYSVGKPQYLENKYL